MKINIAIDGPSAAGKSTIARKLAEKMHYVHLDTGAMYRCTGMKAKKTGIDLEDEKALCAMLQKTQILLTPEGKVFLDGEDVTSLIRTDEISLAASAVSKHPEVRKDLVVLPDAQVKVFMTASAAARAKRRYDQNIASGIPSESLEEITKEIEQRDYQDTHRSASPLTQAPGAVVIDTSDMTIQQVCDAIWALAQPFVIKEEE